MATLQEEAAEIAVGIGTAFCRENAVPVDEQEDCIQEGVLAALEACLTWRQEAKLSTFLYPRVRGAIRDYRAEALNRGTASKHIRVAIVSLHDDVPHALDFDGDPLKYEDILSYGEPPMGYADPLVEVMRAEESSVDEEVQKALSALTATEREAITSVFGIGRRRITQQQHAKRTGVSQPAVAESISRGLRKMASAKGCISSPRGAHQTTKGKKI